MLGALGIDLPTFVLLIVALLLALSFEFVNGFHDTANAVATVIYTHTLKPVQAVVWSGAWNLIGVLTSSGAVAFGIVALLPVELVLNVGSGAGFAMVFALLVSAIIWNVGTWYLGLPASSSHTLIGSIVGVGLMNSFLSPDSAFGEGVNWAKVQDTGKALLISPVLGFVFAALLLLVARALLSRYKALFDAPVGNNPPPLPVRALLMLTCTGVSFAHGSNDGQKGMGLIMLILIGITPVAFSLNLGTSADTVARVATEATQLQGPLAVGASSIDEDRAKTALTQFLKKGHYDDAAHAALAHFNGEIARELSGVQSISQVPPEQRRALRIQLYTVTESLAKLAKQKALPAGVDPKVVEAYRGDLKKITTFIPTWVKVAVAIALGLGTMIGWKRIVVTVGEKIGKAHLTYAQGASAELMAMITIEAADQLGLPVSTTHVLSSGIAGTMVANKAGIQGDTVRNIILAWVLTLPACVFLGAMTFAAGLYLVFNLFGAHH